jgi:hypothetical protein
MAECYLIVFCDVVEKSVAAEAADRVSFSATAYVLLFVFLFLPYAYFNHSDGWNQGARLAQLHAVVLKRTLTIDAYHHVTGDKALIDGHYYSEKAPAISLLALPAFALTVGAQSLLGIDPDAEASWQTSNWITTAGSVAVLAAGGGLAFFALLLGAVGAPAALTATIALFLGSLTLPYATSLFAHAGTIGLLAMTLWSVFARTPPSSRRDYFGGLCAGLAIASEYPAVFPCGLLGLYLLVTDVKRAIRFSVALVPGAALILTVNFLTTGNPLVLAYGSNAAFPEISSSNLFGFNLPTQRAVTSLLWGEYRGLLFWSPVLVMAVPGLVLLARANRGHALVVAGGVLLILLQASSFYGWTGGSSIGPRYLTPALPMLGLAAAYGIKRFPKTGVLLTVVSVLLMMMVTAVAIDPPQEVAHPLREYIFVRIQQGRFVANLGTLVGLSPISSLLVLTAVMAPLGWLLVKESRRAAH